MRMMINSSQVIFKILRVQQSSRLYRLVCPRLYSTSCTSTSLNVALLYTAMYAVTSFVYTKHG